MSAFDSWKNKQAKHASRTIQDVEPVIDWLWESVGDAVEGDILDAATDAIIAEFESGTISVTDVNYILENLGLYAELPEGGPGQ